MKRKTVDVNGYKNSSGADSHTFWVSQTLKCIAFSSIPGYQHVKASDSGEMWELIPQLINSGYRVR